MLKKFFRKNPLGRTLSLRNNTLRTGAGIALSLIGIKTGVDLGVVSESLPVVSTVAGIGWIEIAFGIVFSLLVGVGFISQQVADELEDLVRAILKSKAKDSELGKETSPSETEEIIKEGIDLAEAVAKNFGYDIDLNGDGK